MPKAVNHIGEQRMSTCGQMMTIVDYISYNDITVRFEDNTVAYHKSYSNFKNGKIKNRTVKTFLQKCMELGINANVASFYKKAHPESSDEQLIRDLQFAMRQVRAR